MTTRASDGNKSKSTLSRRDFIKSSAKGGALGAAALAVGPTLLAACGDDDSAPTADNPYKVGFAYISPRDDNGWSTTHDFGREAVMERIPNVETTWVDNVPISAEGGQVFENLASQNDMVIVTSEYADFLTEVVERHPDVSFMEANGHRYDLPNLRPYYVNHHKPAYVMGVAAGMLTESDRLGYVGAFPTATVFNDTNAFLLGARSVNPNVSVQVVMVFSFFDPPAATQATNALIDGGADVIFDVQDDTTPLAVCEERGVWSCIWNKDNREFGPNAYVNAVALDWDDYYVAQVESSIGGDFNNDGVPDLLDIAAGVDNTTWGQNIPGDVAAAGDAARQAIIDGELEVYAGPIVDNEGNERVPAGTALTDREAYDVNWSVEGVSGVV